MILNSYAILLAFVAMLRLVLALLAIGLGARAWFATRRSTSSHDREEQSNRYYLLLLFAIMLVALNLASWPLLYLLLQSYVAEYSSVMCIYGVTRIGEHSQGPARHLSTLLMAMQLSKPTLVFAGGAWFALHLLNRCTATSPLLPRLVFLLIPLGMLAAVDAIAELTYLSIAKTDEAPAAGCCTVEATGDRYMPAGIVHESENGWLTAAFVAAIGIIVCRLGSLTNGRARSIGAIHVLFVFLFALLAMAIGGIFLIDVVAPILLRQPFHHCPYDLLPRVPEAIVAIAIFMVGTFSIGWAWGARTFGVHPETDQFLHRDIRAWLRIGMWCYIASVPMLFFEMALAV